MRSLINDIAKGSGDNCHYQMLGVIKTIAENNKWKTLRYISTGDNRELILKGVGLSEEEEIFVGFQCYQSIADDYYNMNCGVFTGYIAENTFSTQPGCKIYATPSHNNNITYFLIVNEQRIAGCFKVGAPVPVYEHFYVGKFFPYAYPSEYPLPLLCAGTLSENSATRFDDTQHVFPYPGYSYSPNFNKMAYLNPSGVWELPNCYPFTQGSYENNALAGPQGESTLVPAGAHYQIEPIIIQERNDTINPGNVWGEIDGIYFCSGFNNKSENVIQAGNAAMIDQSKFDLAALIYMMNEKDGRAMIMLQNIYRTSWRDYIAMDLQF